MGRSCEGKVALVTGASQYGTGRALTVRLAAEGAKVAFTARRKDGLEETLKEVEAVGGTGLVLQNDLGDPDGGRDTLVARTEAELGPIDYLVNNAVIVTFKPFDQWTIDELQTYQQVNVWGPWLLMSQVVGGMRERGSGSILNLTSHSGELPPGPPFGFKAKIGGAMYGSNKAALNRLTIAAAAECEGQGISVNALTPQVAIRTPATMESGLVAQEFLFEPVETMAEAGLVLLTGDPAALTGRIAFSLQLLVELGRPVHDLAGEELLDGWQPDDLPAIIKEQAGYHASIGWPDVFDFKRPSTPTPASIL